MPRGPYLTEDEKTELWDRYRAGESPNAVARHIGRSRDAVVYHLAQTGGVRPQPRTRSARALSPEEREEISRGTAAGESCRAIARRLGRPHSTVSREINRNGGRECYRAADAEQAALRRGRRPKPSKLELWPELRAVVEDLLELLWSPQQISAWLKLEFPDDPTMQVSHETIYLSLFIQSRGTLRKELAKYLRTQRTLRQARKQQPTGRGHIPGRVMISERPAEAADRAVPGHWEGDLLLGKPTDAIGTLVERSTRFVMLFQLPGGAIRAEAVRERLAETILRLPTSLRRSLTWDQGREMAEHLRFTVDTGVQVYFCNPHSPWQRGSNENTNGLLRQYLPKGHSLANVTQADLDLIADSLNGRPRQTLGWSTPARKLGELLLQSSAAGGATTP
jgi:IS30 family transposase